MKYNFLQNHYRPPNVAWKCLNHTHDCLKRYYRMQEKASGCQNFPVEHAPGPPWQGMHLACVGAFGTRFGLTPPLSKSWSRPCSNQQNEHNPTWCRIDSEETIPWNVDDRQAVSDDRWTATVLIIRMKTARWTMTYLSQNKMALEVKGHGLPISMRLWKWLTNGQQWYGQQSISIWSGKFAITGGAMMTKLIPVWAVQYILIYWPKANISVSLDLCHLWYLFSDWAWHFRGWGINYHRIWLLLFRFCF